MTTLPEDKAVPVAEGLFTWPERGVTGGRPRWGKQSLTGRA